MPQLVEAANHYVNARTLVLSALKIGSVWSLALADTPNSDVTPALLAAVVQRCYPAVVHINEQTLADSYLMRQLLHTKLERLSCDLKTLQLLVAMHSTYPGTNSLAHITVTSEQLVVEHMSNVFAAFPALETVEQTQINFANFMRLAAMHTQPGKPASALPKANPALKEGLPLYTVTWRVFRDSQHHQRLRFMHYSFECAVRWTDILQLAQDFHNRKFIPAEQVVYLGDLDPGQNASEFLLTLLQTRAKYVTAEFYKGTSWCREHTDKVQKYETATTHFTMRKVQGAAGQVTIDYSTIWLLAASESLRFLHFVDVAMGDSALHMFQVVRQRLGLPFCATTLTNCKILPSASTAK